jgi:HEAT repeat protein
MTRKRKNEDASTMEVEDTKNEEEFKRVKFDIGGMDIPSLVALLSHENTKVRAQAGETLCNLAIDPTNRDKIREAGGIGPLISLLSDGDTGVRRGAAAALMNTAANRTNMTAIREANGIIPLITSLSDEDEEVRKGASIALLNLALETTNKATILSRGMVPLRSRLSDGNVVVRQYAARIFHCLSNDAKIIPDAIPKARGTAAVVDMLSNEDEVVREMGAKTLLNLSVHSPNGAAIRVAGGIISLISLLSDSKALVRNLAAGALSNLAWKNPNNQVAIREANGIAPLVSLLSDEDRLVRKHATSALSNLAPNKENRDTIIECDGYAALERLLEQYDSEIYNLARDALNKF